MTRDDEFASITSWAPPDAGLPCATRVDEGNKLVLFIIPEPGNLALLALGGLALIRRCC